MTEMKILIGCQLVAVSVVVTVFVSLRLSHNHPAQHTPQFLSKCHKFFFLICTDSSDRIPYSRQHLPGER